MTGTEIERLFVSLGIDPAGVVRGAAEAVRAVADMAARIATDSTAGAAAMASAFAMASASVIRSIEDAVNRAIDSFAQYQESLAKITGLAGASAEQTRQWGKEILALGPAMGQAPKDLAEAMFFISSAGLRGRDGMMALEASAKAAASGLGDVKTIAHTVTYALSAYAGTGLTAARATDILTAAGREGNMEVTKFSAAIGTVLPIASAAGVSFQEVAGTMAVLTHTGMSVAAAGISVQSMLMALAKPGADAQAALASVNLSMVELRKLAREPEGIIKVMRRLDEAFQGNDEAIAHVIPNIRALRGTLSILHQDAGAVDRVMRGVRDSVGATDEAFAVMSDTLSFAFKQAKEGAAAAAIEMGQILAPTVKDVAVIAAEALKWFRSWPPVLKASVAITALVAAGVMSVAAAIGIATLGIIAAGIAFNVAFGGVGLLVGVLVTGAAALYAGVAGVVGVTWGLGVSLAYALGVFDEIRRVAVETWDWLLPVRNALLLLWRTVEGIGSAAFAALKQAAMAAWRDITGEARIDWDQIRNFMLDAVIGAEFALLNFQKAWELASVGVKYAVEAMKNSILFLFTDVVPAAGRWLLENLPAMLIRAWIAAQAATAAVIRASWEWTIAGFQTLFTNLLEIARKVDWAGVWHGILVAARAAFGETMLAIAIALVNLPDLVQGKKRFADVWAPVGVHQPVEQKVDLQAPPPQDVRRVAAVAQAAAQAAANHANRGGLLDVAPFVMPARVEGDREKDLREEFERMGHEAGIGFAQFRRLRLAQIAEMEKIRKAADEAAGLTPKPASDQEWHRHKAGKESFDAVLFESAEAAARVARYREMLAGSFVDAQQVEAQKEARIAADRMLALENELRLTQQIAEVRRDMNRREENLGVRTSRPESPAFGEMVAPRPLDPLDEAYPQRFGERDLRRRQFAPRVPEIDPAVMEAIREANRSSERFQSRLDEEQQLRRRPGVGGEEERPVSRGPRRDREQEPLPVRQPDVVAASPDQAEVERQRQMIALLTELVNLQRAQARKPPLAIEETNA